MCLLTNMAPPSNFCLAIKHKQLTHSKRKYLENTPPSSLLRACILFSRLSGQLSPILTYSHASPQTYYTNSTKESSKITSRNGVWPSQAKRHLIVSFKQSHPIPDCGIGRMAFLMLSSGLALTTNSFNGFL